MLSHRDGGWDTVPRPHQEESGVIILGLTLPAPDSRSLHLANLQHQNHVRGRALQFAIEPAILRLWHQHRDDIPRLKPQQGPVGTRRVGHDGLNSRCATPLPALADAAGLTKGTRTGRTARREQTCGEASQRSGWSLASSCKTHAASKGPVLPQSSNYSSGGADGLSGREQSIAWEKQGKHPAGDSQLKPNPFVLRCPLWPNAKSIGTACPG